MKVPEYFSRIKRAADYLPGNPHSALIGSGVWLLASGDNNYVEAAGALLISTSAGIAAYEVQKAWRNLVEIRGNRSQKYEITEIPYRIPHNNGAL